MIGGKGRPLKEEVGVLHEEDITVYSENIVPESYGPGSQLMMQVLETSNPPQLKKKQFLPLQGHLITSSTSADWFPQPTMSGRADDDQVHPN